MDPKVAEMIRAMCKAQPFFELVGGEVVRLAPGEADLRIGFREDLTQHSGVLHAGVTTTLADNACGCAAATLYELGSYALTTEFKINLLAPAFGDALVARGRVIKAGSRMSTCASDVFALQDGKEVLVATMLASIFRAEGASG